MYGRVIQSSGPFSKLNYFSYVTETDGKWRNLAQTLAGFGQLDHVHRRRAAALPTRPHFSDASSFQIGVSRGRTSLSLHVSMSEAIVAQCSAPPSDPANNAF